jgi:predicted nucleic acid-binding Zn ribbon protein
MRGRRRTIASLLAETLSPRAEARLAAVVAAFAEAGGQVLARQAVVRGLTRDGRLIVVARSPEWAREVEHLGTELCAKVNARLGSPVATGVAVRVGPLSDRRNA